jgi:hypothetical protein
LCQNGLFLEDASRSDEAAKPIPLAIAKFNRKAVTFSRPGLWKIEQANGSFLLVVKKIAS